NDHGDVRQPVLYRFHLTDAAPTREQISRPTGGDVGLDPEHALGEVTFGDPHGLAFGDDGELYIADRQRNVVYVALPNAQGVIARDSAVERAFGDGVGKQIAKPGKHFVGGAFSLNQPILLSSAGDGTVLVLNPFGVARYDRKARDATWLVQDTSA